MQLTKNSTKSFKSTINSERKRQNCFARSNSNSSYRNTKSLAQSQSLSLSKFYIKNAYVNLKQLAPNGEIAQMGPTKKLKHKMNENQRNGKSILTKICKVQADLNKKTVPSTVSIPQLLEQFQRLKESLKVQARINSQQKLLLSQARIENQALKKQIKILKQKESSIASNSKERSTNRINQNLSFIEPETREKKYQKVGQLESNQINELRKKVDEMMQENFLLRRIANKGIKKSNNSEFLSMQPQIEKMKVQLFQARQQVKRLNLLNSHLQRKNFKQAQSQLKSKTFEYNQLRNKYTELLEKYKNIRKQHVESLAKIRIFEQNQGSLKESLNFSQLSSLDDILDPENPEKQQNFFSGVKKRTIYN